MKNLMIFLIILIVLVSGISYLYITNKANYNMAKKENWQYESYYNQEITGSELTTIINKAIDSNIKNEIEKNDKGIYIDNGKNSINIDIKFTDDENTHKMEILYKGGMEKFIQFYGNIKFKCVKIDYHKANNRVKYLLFEQISE